MRRERTQINKIINEKEEITMDTAEIQKIKRVREDSEYLDGNKFENLEEMDTLLETYIPPKTESRRRRSTQQTNH